MNDLVQQLINPVIHKPTGGRVIMHWDSPRQIIYTMRKELPRKPREASAPIVISDLEKYRRIFDMHVSGMNYTQIANELNIPHSTPRYAIRRYKKYQKQQAMDAANG